MKIRSEFKEVAGCQFEECLSDYSSKSLTTKVVREKNQEALKARCQLKLSCDLCIIENRLDLTRSITQIVSVEGDLLQLSCLLKGSSQIVSKQKDLKLEAGRIYVSTRCNDQQFIKLPPAKSHCATILISCSYVLKLLSHEKWAQEDPVYNALKAGKTIDLGKFDVPLEFPLYQVLEDILSCDWDATRQLSYIEIKLRELFLQLHYQKQLDTKANKNYSEDCLKKLREARAYLTMNYHSPPTIHALSRIVLLNEVQLKSGFKDIYGSTIRGYITELRMKGAPGLLVEHTVNETAGLLGYMSVSHFISNFKKFHDQTPKQFLVKLR